ncbi:3895_t:CDS:2 [Funneliformis caledonium]|uniref:3895_t:CDS:1 n=1 Tax=Funneliformis caledonium TaxID=1117310 RepID=A0A9N9FL29_9GLOM|nr:3895_t:CDS:2 [Funneliformis caledonium]
MSVYKAIASLELSQEERKALRVLFTNNPSKKTEAEEIIPTCTNKEQVDYLRELLTSGMYPFNIKFCVMNIKANLRKKVIEFWKNLDRAEIIFQLNEPFDSELLEYFEIKGEQDLDFNLRPGISSKHNKYAYERLGSFLLIRDCYKELIKAFNRDISKFGCIITGTPGIGKSYFGLYLLYYIHLHYPKATIVWQLADSDIHQCYQFMPNAQKPEKSGAYVILLTSPKAELYQSMWKSEGNERRKCDRFTCEKLEMLMGRWGLIPRILKKWKDELYGETEFDKLINEVDLVKCLRSVNEEGMSKDSASGRLIHIIVEPDFRKYKFCFASSLVSDSLIDAYERYQNSNIRDFLQSSFSLDQEYFETTDPFVYNGNENSLDLFQATVSTAHGVKVKGLEKIKAYVRSGDIKLYFVVPSDKFDVYPWQSYRGPNNLVSSSHLPWINDLKQYVLDINVRKFYSDSE